MYIQAAIAKIIKKVLKSKTTSVLIYELLEYLECLINGKETYEEFYQFFQTGQLQRQVF
jgi:hypothetical protein